MGTPMASECDAPFIVDCNVLDWPIDGDKSLSERARHFVASFDAHKFRTRFVSRHHRRGVIDWERESLSTDCHLADLLDWMGGASADSDSAKRPRRTIAASIVTESDAPASSSVDVDVDSYWCYSGYHRLRDRLDDNAQRRALDWRRLSLPYDAHDSTLWLGSAGAYTPTHQDTYGFNVHAQLDGDKLWVLFPPDDARQLRATRLPYEESSVFSGVDILSAPESLRTCRPHVTTVRAGQVLYVPPGWFHFVMCLSTPTIAANCWVPISADDAARRREGVTRVLASMLLNSDLIDLPDINDRTELAALIDTDDCLDTLQNTLDDDGDTTSADTLHAHFLRTHKSLALPVKQCTHEELSTRLDCARSQCGITLTDAGDTQTAQTSSIDSLKSALARAILDASVAEKITAILHLNLAT